MALNPNDISASGIQSPAIDGEEVTPHDSNQLGQYSRALYVGGTGDLEVITATGNTIVLAAVPAGSIIPIRCGTVKATNTTATNIVALY